MTKARGKKTFQAPYTKTEIQPGWYPHKGATYSAKPTRTVQDLASQTDINIIMRNQAITGTVPGAPRQPIYGDFSEIPTDLRGMIEISRSVNQLLYKLPPELQGMDRNEILSLTPEQLAEKLKKPAPNPEDKKDDVK